MKATYMYGAGDVRIVDAPDPEILEPTDAIIRVTRTCICGSDLHPYHEMEVSETGQAMGHESMGIIEDIGADVTTLKKGDQVVMPMFCTDGTCVFCQEGIRTGCPNVSFFGRVGMPGAQAEAIRIPWADASLVKIDASEDEALMSSILSLSDVMSTGHHGAIIADVQPGRTAAVIGDGAVGLCAVIAAKRLGAEQIIILGHHKSRTDLALELGATDVVSERGHDALARVRELTNNEGARSVIECVGSEEAIQAAVSMVRPGGAISRMGVPHYEAVPMAFVQWVKNVRVGGGPTPVRTYIDELLADVLEGKIEPGRVFDRTIELDGVPDGYKAMDDREALKIMVTP